VVFDVHDRDRKVARFAFPRQPDADRRRLSDYFRPLGTERDLVGFQAVSAGTRAGQYLEELQRRVDCSRMLYGNSVASSTAEVLRIPVVAPINRPTDREMASQRAWSKCRPRIIDDSQSRRSTAR
jgi:hypothetical protein